MLASVMSFPCKWSRCRLVSCAMVLAEVSPQEARSNSARCGKPAKASASCDMPAAHHNCRLGVSLGKVVTIL